MNYSFSVLFVGEGRVTVEADSEDEARFLLSSANLPIEEVLDSWDYEDYRLLSTDEEEE